MIKKIYFFLQFSTIFFLLIASLLVFIFFQKDVAPFLAKKYLKELSVEYSSLEGTLFNGVEIKDFRYKESIKAKKLNIKYNLISLIRPTPRVASVTANGVFIDLDKLLDSNNTQDLSSNFAFNISDTELKNATLVYKSERVYFDFSGSNLSYREVVDIDKIYLKLKTKYADIELNGNVKANALRAKSYILISDETSVKYIDFLTYMPKRLAVDLDINSKEINLKTNIKNVGIKTIPELGAEDVELDFSYSIDKENFTLKTNYKAKYEEYEAVVTQSTLVDKNKKVTSDIKAEIVNDKNRLPFDEFAIKVDYENNTTKAFFSAKDISLNLLTQDFKSFSLDGDSIYAKFDAEILKNLDETFLQAKLYPKQKYLKYKNYNLKRFSKINLYAYEKNKNVLLHINSDILSLVLFGNETKVKGFADLGSAHFEVDSDIENKTATIQTKIASFNTFIKEVDIKPLDVFFDAKITAKTDISFKETLEVYSKVDIPIYTLKLDSKREFSDIDNSFEFFYKENEFTLKKYNIGVQNMRIYSKKASKIILNSDSNIEFREFWIYDNVLLKGLVKTADMSADFSIKSDNFHYETKDVNVTLMVDLKVNIEADKKQHINGELKILDGVITYESKKDYTITDEDIIIIQDIKEQEWQNNREINIHVTSEKPINYKVKDISATFVPDLILYQEMDSYLQIFGILNIKNGNINIRDKNFELNESEIYFYGGKEINPYLNLNLHFNTIDNIEIEIYITNRLNSPIIILSSKPAMSQNDILSYILFDGSTSSIFDETSNSSKTSLNTLLLGTGLKKALNETTGVNIDTLNILTNKEGTLGYEIGTRFNKKIRIVYRNDEISSLILQYSLNKSLRIDVDVKETGQGISIIYMKDFDLNIP